MNTDLMKNKAALEFFEEVPPLLQKLFGIRRYVPPPGYLSPNVAEMGMVANMLNCKLFGGSRELKGSMGILVRMACWQSMHGWPMYAITPELCEAMLLTEPPGDITWGELQWPMEAATFLLPPLPQLQEHLMCREVPPAVSVARMRAPSTPEMVSGAQLLGLERLPDSWEPREMLVLHSFDPKVGNYAMHDVSARPEWTLDYSMSKECVRAPEAEGDLVCDEEDNLRMTRTIRLTVNLLAFMSSTYEPEEIEALKVGDRPERREKHKKGKKVDALYGVRWLGQGYKLRRPPVGGGHHASPIWHWRRGHFRHQPYGPGRKLKRTIWIEPYCVGAEDREQLNNQEKKGQKHE